MPTHGSCLTSAHIRLWHNRRSSACPVAGAEGGHVYTSGKTRFRVTTARLSFRLASMYTFVAFWQNGFACAANNKEPQRRYRQNAATYSVPPVSAT